MESEAFDGWIMLAKCGLGLVVVVLLAVIGASEKVDCGAAGEIAAQNVVGKAAQPEN